MSILKLAKSLCAATLRRARRIGRCAVFRSFQMLACCFSECVATAPGESLDTKVFRVGECQKALDRACKKVGTDRITHHDLRHLFATRCIESGVDIPTVSRWARTQGRRRTRNENVRASEARAQHCSSAARELRAGRSKASRRDRIPRYGLTSGRGVAARKAILFSDRAGYTGTAPPEPAVHPASVCVKLPGT
jgi:Phage integrase family